MADYHADTPYGNYRDFDNPETAYEIIDNALSRKVIRDSIRESYNQWLEDTAREYFCDVGDWNEEWRDAWREVVGETV